MRHMRRLYAEWATGQSGAAAVEFALILPFVVMLYIGLVDTVSYVSASRKVSNAAESLADLVSRSGQTVSPHALDDALTGAELILKLESMGSVSLALNNYRNSQDSVELAWSRDSSEESDCPASPPENLNTLMASGNDVILASVCVSFSPPLGGKIGTYVFGSSSMTIRAQATTRPRESDQINCPDCGE